MKKQLFSIEINKSRNKVYGFAFLPTIVLEAHPTHKVWHLVWLEAYEVFQGKKFIIFK